MLSGLDCLISQVWKLPSGRYKACIWNGKRAADGRRRYRLGEYESPDEVAIHPKNIQVNKVTYESRARRVT